jgi:hypothetical protein
MEANGTWTPIPNRGCLNGLRRVGRAGAVATRSGAGKSQLQWSRGLLAAEACAVNPAPRPASSFNGAAACWPRRLVQRREGRGWSVSFNGAAACWPRRRARLRGLRLLSPCFNGAAACWPRRHPNHPRAAQRLHASMGPRLIGRGSGGDVVSPVGPVVASMGPRLVGRGGGGLDHDRRRWEVASMEPRLVGRGGLRDAMNPSQV